MMIIIPLSHEKMEAQRFPYITLGIVLVNVFLFLIMNHVVLPEANKEYFERKQELVAYYFEHPYLELPESANLPEELTYYGQPELHETMSEVDQKTAVMDNVLKDLGLAEEPEEEDEEALALRMQEEQRQLNKLVQAFEESIEQFPNIKYGYIPARGGFFTIISSIFMHSGYGHLIFNMLFLWLSGCNIEDVWGRIIYPVFYLLGGVLATLAHGMISPESSVPLIGASGAIAAVMGAFMVRMYDTKIHFVYFIFALRLIRGKFSAPAYIMLPLWLLQQLLGAATAHSMGGGVAFWAHIGGFIFGAIIAMIFKVTEFERKFIAPNIEKKVAIVDEHLATGIEKFQEGDVDGAIQDLKTALQNTPNDPIALSELSKAYFKQGDRKLALREFKRAVFLYIKRGEMNDAVDQYLELIVEMPEMMLDPPQQMKIATELERRAGHEASKYSDKEEAREKEYEMYSHAASAYRKIVSHYQRQKETLEHPNAIKALTRYADLNLLSLERPKDAWKAYQMLMRSPRLSSEQKQKIQSKIQQAMNDVSQQAKAAKLQKAKKKVETIRERHQPEKPSKKPKPNIPIQKRLKLIPDGDAPAKYEVASVAPIEANKVLPAEGGLELKRPSEPPITFEEISVISVFQIREAKRKSSSSPRKKKETSSLSFESTQEIVYADLFLAGISRPYRIASNQVAYPRFFRKLHRNSFDNFRQLLFHIISNLDSVYVDQGAMTFLKTGKPTVFSDQNELAIHEKIFWKQLKGAVRFQCEHCYEVYWIDGMKIPKDGAKTTCAKCGKPMLVKPLHAQK